MKGSAKPNGDPLASPPSPPGGKQEVKLRLNKKIIKQNLKLKLLGERSFKI